MLKNTMDTYGSVTKTLHWVIAVLVIGMLIFGFILTSMKEGPATGMLIGLHKSVGLTILLLMIVRVFWRFANPQPLLPLSVPRWEKWASHSVHFFIYLAVFAMPVTGLFLSSFAGRPVMFWGWFNAALPLPVEKALSKTFFSAHGVIAWILIGLLALHVAAALKHHFIEKNSVLKRMLPGG